MRPRASRPRLAQALLAGALALATAGSMNASSASIIASVRVASQQVGLDLSATQARVGDLVRAHVTVTNAGASRLSAVVVEIRVDPSGVTVRGATTTTISKLQPGHDTTVSWVLCATRAGNYLVLARATVDGVSVESPARLLTVAGQRQRGCT